jgi:hypothetical protein
LYSAFTYIQAPMTSSFFPQHYHQIDPQGTPGRDPYNREGSGEETTSSITVSGPI